MAGHVRARRPPSPPPTTQQHHQQAPQYSQRFPHPRDSHLDADERRAAATANGYLPPSRSKQLFPLGGLTLSSGEWKLLFVIVLVAAAVRLFRLSKPNSVVFDEVHFGKFASKYIKTQYFVDVHPPLAKLLITLAAFLFGYDGQFDFKDIGKIYEHVPYVAMRMVPTTLGIATIPLAYLTLRALDCRATTALLASLFLTFENGLITQSRHILLDSPLIFFTALSIFLWTAFCNHDKHPSQAFTLEWWTWLTLTGLSLGAVVSCKWVGLFTIATVGVSTCVQLWSLLGDLRVSSRTFVHHFAARALCLIVIPVVFYMLMFQIHFLILENSGDGDGFMSSEFQHTLGGRGMEDTFADVGLGTQVTIRHLNTQGGYLHSHMHTYPAGSGQQQVTLYPHRDSNNEWRIYNASSGSDDQDDEDWRDLNPLSFPIYNGARIKLKHVPTNRHLHSHDFRPPVSDVDFQNEVSAYGMEGFSGDANDDWFLEIEHGDHGKRDRESRVRLRTLRTVFRLRHALTGCYLFSHKIKLPEWGFEQQEVTCNKNAVRKNSLWFVETAGHPNMPSTAPKVNYKLPGFLAKFLELQQVMWTTNAGLTDRHTYDSRPSAWPRLSRGINFWVKDHRQIYLVGNPLVWWLSTCSVVLYAVVRGFLILRAQRGYRDFDNTKVVKYDTLCGFLFIGWSLHYFPFFLMSRQLFLHHYFPALYFAVLLSCAGFDLVTSTLRPRVRLQIAAVLLIVAVWHFGRFSPLAYGSPWTKSKCESAKWVKTWDFSCNDFLDDYSQYNNIGFTPQNPTVAHTTVGGEADGRPPIVVPHANDKDGKHQQNIVAMGDANNNNNNGAPKKGDLAGEPGKKDAKDNNKAKDAAGDAEEVVTTGVVVAGVPEPGPNVFGVDEGQSKAHAQGGGAVGGGGGDKVLTATTEKEIRTVAGGAGAGVPVAGPVVGGTSKDVEKERKEKEEKVEKVKDEKAKDEKAKDETEKGEKEKVEKTKDEKAKDEKAKDEKEQPKEGEAKNEGKRMQKEEEGKAATDTNDASKPKKQKPVVEGPLREAELEAKLAAEELFPDESR